MKRLMTLIMILGLVAAACGGSSESENEIIVLEEGVYTATLEVKSTWDWENVIWEERRGFTVRLNVIDSTEEIVGADIGLWMDRTDFQITFRDSTLYTASEEGVINPNFHQSQPTQFLITEEQRQKIFALTVGDIITVEYNKVVPNGRVASIISTEPVISVADYLIGDPVYETLDKAIDWRGKHSRVNKEITFP